MIFTVCHTALEIEIARLRAIIADIRAENTPFAEHIGNFERKLAEFEAAFEQHKKGCS